MSRKLYILFVLITTFSACHKEIDIKLEETKAKLVVEGVIENNEFAYVSLSKSTPYFSPVDSNTFTKMFIDDALVIVSDGAQYDTLKYQFYPSFPPFRFQGSKIKGEINKTYSLSIKYEGQTYHSKTQILKPIPIDSVKYKYDIESDSLGYLWFYANDPIDEVNYYRIHLLDLNIDPSQELPIWLHSNYSVADDVFFNGKLMENRMYKPKNPLKPFDYYEEHKEDWWAFKMDEEYLIKLSQIDYESFTFWKTTEQVINNAGNPFSAPSTVQSNIEPNALGSWCGYASSIVHVTITEDMIIE